MRWLARKFWLLVAALIVSLALLVQTGRILSPHISDYQPQISSWLAQRLGVPVQIGHISLHWRALEVVLQVDGLRLGRGGELRLGRGLFHLDLLASLWNRDLVWKNLEIEDFNAELVRVSRANWRIKGFPRSRAVAGGTAAAETELDLSDPARIFQLSPRIQVDNARIGLQLNDNRQAALDFQQIFLENSAGFRRLTARAAVSGTGIAQDTDNETLYLVLEGHGKPREAETFRMLGYLQFNELLLSGDLVALLNELSPLPEKYFWAHSKRTSGRLWLENKPQQGYQFHGQLALTQAQNEKDTARASLLSPLQSLAANLQGHWQPGGDWQLILEDTRLAWGKSNVAPFDLQLAGKAAGGLNLALDQIDLGGWHRVLKQLQLVPPKAARWLNALEPGGSLEKVHFTYSDGGEMLFRANLRAVAAKAFNQAPGVSDVNGYLELNRHRGFVQLNSTAGFVAHFPNLYPKAFTFQQAQGTVAWEVDAADNSVAVFSGPLQLDGGLGRVSGQFLLELPYVAATKPSAFTLALGLKGAAVSAQSALIPNQVSKNLRTWLQRGLGEKNTGRIDEAGFIYRGYGYRNEIQTEQNAPLLRLGGQPQRLTVQTRAKISDTELDYAPGWPQARDIDAQVYVNDTEVSVRAPRAKLWSVDAEQIAVMVKPEGAGLRLDVGAQLTGPAADGLKLLQQSPLREQLGSAFDNWALDGKMRGELTLSQPLGGAKFAPQQKVDLQLSDARLKLKNLDLAIDGLSGALHYSSRSGLDGSAFTGSLWGFPLEAKLQHAGRGTQRDTEVIVAGQSSAAALQSWSKIPELSWLDGEFNYTTRITIPAKAKHKPYRAVLEAETDLENVAVNLPAPLGKTPEQKTRLTLRVPIAEEGNRYHLRYGDQLQGQIWQRNGSLQRVGIGLNAAPALPQQAGVAIVGELPQIDVAGWRQALAIYTAETSGRAPTLQQPESAQVSPQAALPVSLDIRTNQLLLGALTIDNVHLQGHGRGGAWQLQFDSKIAAGELRGAFNSPTPLQLDLTYLQLPALDIGGKKPGAKVPANARAPKPDPWQGFDFTSLPPLDFSTKSLRFGTEDFGSWSFRLQPAANQLTASDIKGSLRGVTVAGATDKAAGAQLVWSRDAAGAERSRFSGRLRGGDLEQVLQAWGQEPLLKSKSASFNTQLHWPGSPAGARVNALTGSIGIDIRQGRFLRASDDAGTALLRLLSIFNFDTWARRLRLDFSDLVQSGLTFDRVRGEIQLAGDGKLSIVEPIRVDSPSGKLQMAGQVDLKRENLDLNLIVTLPVGNNLALVAGLAGGLPAAAGVYLISKVFKKQVDKVASVSYRISGSWEDPQERFEGLFDDGTDQSPPQSKGPAPMDKRLTASP